MKAISLENLAQFKSKCDEIYAQKSSIETFEIPTTDWLALSDKEPFAYQASITATANIGEDTIVELINDNAVLFSTYGFSIGEILGQGIAIYALAIPEEAVTFKLKIGA